MSKVVKSIGRAIGNVVKGVVKAIGKVVTAVLNFVTAPFMGPFGNMGNLPNSGDESSRQQGVLVTIQGGGDVSIPVVYGLRQVGGIVFHAETGSSNNKYLWVAYALSEGPIEGMFQLSIEDEDITTPELITALNAGLAINYTRTGSRYSGRCQFQFWKGAFFPDPTTLNTGTFPGNVNHVCTDSPTWRDRTHVMNGVAVLMARYEWRSEAGADNVDNNPFGGGIPNIKATIMGRRVTSAIPTNNQAGIEYGAAGFEERYSTNPAEILADYLRNPRYGKGLSLSEINIPSFVRAASKFNQLVTYTTGVTGPIQTCNYVLDTNNSILSNVKILLQGCRSYMPYIQGQYKLFVEDAGNETDITSGAATVVATFDKDSIVGDIVYGGVDRSAQYTEVEVTYVSPSDKFVNQTAIFPPTQAERDSVKALDGGRVNRGAFTFSTLTNAYLAQDMARLIFNKSRFQQTCSLTVSARGMELEPGDNIFIRGMILDFFDTNIEPGDNVPWRIVSARLNDNYTVTLDTVRNPDFIYPHTRFGERDRVATPFLPGPGAPQQPHTPDDIEDNPPGGSIGTPDPNGPGFDQPPPTNPVDPVNGGGVGDENNPGGPTTPPTTPPPPPFNNTIDVTRADYVATANTVTATIQYRQPDHPQYAGVVFYYRRSGFALDPVRTEENTNKPGGGLDTTHVFTNLIRGSTPYIVDSRVKYQDGKGVISYSESVNRFTLNVAGAVSTDNPPDNPQLVITGWAPPISTGDPNSRDTNFDTIIAQPTYVSAGVPTASRGLIMQVAQDINNSALTFDITGVRIYYKLNSVSFYKSYTEIFDGSYFPGAPYTFTPTLDLGLSTHPNVDNATDNFDFVMRFVYRDGTEGTRQVRFINKDIENTTNSIVFGVGLLSGTRATYVEASTAFTPEPEPPGSVADQREMEIFVRSTSDAGDKNQIIWDIIPPNAANINNWYGIRVKFRPIPLAGGVAGEFETVDALPVRFNSVLSTFELPLSIAYDQVYQFVLTPMVRHSGARVEAFRSVIQLGAIHDRSRAPDYPRDGNWNSTMQMSTINTNEISTVQTTPFPTTDAQVTIPANTFVKILRSTTDRTSNTAYFELQYNVSHVVGLTGVRIYRRVGRGGNLGTGLRGGSALYYGLGRWEFVDITPGTNATTLANGNILVNLRTPTSFDEYNVYHDVPGTIGGALLSSTAPYTARKVLYPINGSDFMEYVLQVTTSGGASAVVTVMPKISTNAVNTVLLPLRVPFDSFDGRDAGYQRNITPSANDGSRASTANNLLNVSRTTIYTAPTPLRGSAII